MRNARDPNDDTPTVVALPAGSYKVEAEALNCDSSRVNVLMPVVIKPGQATIAHLEGDWNPPGQYQETELAKLPCGRVIGWRAPEAGFASMPTKLASQLIQARRIRPVRAQSSSRTSLTAQVG